MPESSKLVLITRNDGAPQDSAGEGFAARHPDLAYVFGPTVRAFYVVGCLSLDLLAPLQVIQLLPGEEILALPPLVAALAVLAYAEYRLYLRLWPSSRRREIVGVAGQRRF